MLKVDLTRFTDNPRASEKRLKRLLWGAVWTLFARPVPRAMMNGWKLFLLRSFGARVASTAVVYSGAHIYAPWNLEMGEHSCIASGVDCYNADKVTIGAHVIVSQKASLYTASHRIDSGCFEWVCAPITIEDQAWVAAESFVMMGVTIGQGAVVGARAAVFRDVAPWTVVGGNPAKFIKNREITC